MSLAMKLLPMVSGGAAPVEPDPVWADVHTLIHVVDGEIVDAKGKSVDVGNVTADDDAGLPGANVMDFSHVSYNCVSVPGEDTFNYLHDGTTSWTVDAYVKRYYFYRTTHPIFNTGRQTYYPRASSGIVGEEFCCTIAAPFTALVNTCADCDLTNAVWYHVEFGFDRDNACIYQFIDGVLVDTVAVEGEHSTDNHVGPLWIGMSGVPFTGRIGAIRFTKALRHSATFTKPTFPFPTA